MMRQVFNPYQNTFLYEYAYENMNLVLDKISFLKQHQKAVARTAYGQRADRLEKLAFLLQENKDLLAGQITLESGKILADSLVELRRSYEVVKLAAAEIRTWQGESYMSDLFASTDDKIIMSMSAPLGIILCITPFNFPVNLALHKIAPALAMGNSVLWKPAEMNYQTSQMLLDLLRQAGFGEEYVQMIMPETKDMPHIVAHPDVIAMSFTGGQKAADSISKHAGCKKLLMELGGNDALVVMPDADIAKAVSSAIAHRFGYAGQRCTASKRVFVHDSVYETFKKLLLEKTVLLKSGDPMHPDTFLCPVIHKQAAEQMMVFVQDALDKGATSLLPIVRQDNQIAPIILENIIPDMDLMTQEVFAPVMPLIRFQTIEQAIDLINQSELGLQAGIFTQEIAVAKRFYQELHVSGVIMNEGSGYRLDHIAFGGAKKSGIGQEGVRYTMQAMSVIKSLVL